jgi:hypothetical protein
VPKRSIEVMASVLTPMVSMTSVSPSQWPTESPVGEGGSFAGCFLPAVRPAPVHYRNGSVWVDNTPPTLSTVLGSGLQFTALQPPYGA